MRRWLDPKWYGFLWQRKDRRGLAVVVLLLLVALGAGGYAAASSMRSNNSAVGIVKIAEIKHKVRVHGRERVVTQYVTLATTEVAKPSTVFQTQVVTRPVVQTVRGTPVVRRLVVSVTGMGSTVTRVAIITRARTLTQHQTVTQATTQTSLQTVTQPTTVTRRVTTTEPGTTVTVTGAVLTVTVTKTVTRTTTVTASLPTTTK
jgi:hypothetical protein